MGEKILGLKHQNGKVFIINTENEWEEASISLIPTLNALALKFENYNYPQKTLRQDYFFEDERDLGIGSLKTYKDNDGDLTVKFSLEKDEDFDIDEDEAFTDEIVKKPKFSNVSTRENSGFDEAERKSFKGKQGQYSIIKRSEKTGCYDAFSKTRNHLKKEMLHKAKKLAKNIDRMVIPSSVYNIGANYRNGSKLQKFTGMPGELLIGKFIRDKVEKKDTISKNFYINQEE